MPSPKAQTAKAQPDSAGTAAPLTHYVQTLATPGNKDGGAGAVEVDVRI